VTRIANSISGTVKVVHVLEECCEVWVSGGVAEAVVVSSALPRRAGANIICVRVWPLREEWGQYFKTENTQFLSLQHYC